MSPKRDLTCPSKFYTFSKISPCAQIGPDTIGNGYVINEVYRRYTVRVKKEGNTDLISNL